MPVFFECESAGIKRTSALTILPYVETKKAYYGETEKVFYDVPIGNVTVFIGGYNGSYAANRVENRLIVSFDTLEEETDVTITIQ